MGAFLLMTVCGCAVEHQLVLLWVVLYEHQNVSWLTNGWHCLHS